MKEVTNKWWFWVLMTLLVVFVITIAVSPRPPALEEETDLSSMIKEAEVEDYEPEVDYFKENYMQGCSPYGELDTFCECSYDYLKSRLGEDGMLEMGLEMDRTGGTPQEVFDATNACSEYLH